MFNYNELVEIVDNKCYHNFEIGEIVKIVDVYGSGEDVYYDAQCLRRKENWSWSITSECAKRIDQ